MQLNHYYGKVEIDKSIVAGWFTDELALKLLLLIYFETSEPLCDMFMPEPMKTGELFTLFDNVLHALDLNNKQSRRLLNLLKRMSPSTIEYEILTYKTRHKYLKIRFSKRS